jgi:acetyl-CoA carboxylase carboxyltransferase component
MSSEGVPQLALVNGLCTAGAAYTPTMSDQVMIVISIFANFLTKK